MNPKSKRLFRLPRSFLWIKGPMEEYAVHFEASALAVDPDELAASDTFQEELDDISAEDVEAA